MKLGFCSIGALDRPLREVAAAAAAAGLDGLEITGRPPHTGEDDTLEAVRAAGAMVRDHGLEVLAYGSYLGKSGPRTPAHAAREVERARALGTDLLRVWAEPEADASGPGLEAVATLLRHACEAANAAGVTVVVERHIGSWADTAERVERLFAAVDRRELALNYQVLDLMPEADLESLPEDVRRLVPLARYVHLKNYRPPEKPGGPLRPFASLEGGALDCRALLAAIVAAGYQGPMSIEFLGFEQDPLPEKLARDATFARGVLAALA